MKLQRPSERGVTLILVAGVLAILAALGTGFYTMMLMQTKSALHYSDSVRAEMMAKAGIFDAIGRLRQQAYEKTEDPTDPWYQVDYLNGAVKRVSYSELNTAERDKNGFYLTQPFSRSLQRTTGDAYSDRYSLNVSDAASKIHVNAGDNLGVILDNLCRVIGPPLVAADPDRLQPAVWDQYGAAGYKTNPDDKKTQGACYYMATARAPNGKPDVGPDKWIDGDQPPLKKADGSAVYGDGYAIARYRSVHGAFLSISDVKNALTFVANPSHPELEELEREVKFNAIKDYITINSWVDTNTICVGKFEWVDDVYGIAIDRDKSWVEDAGVTADPQNHRGSLRGSYVSIINGHGAGQLRRIKTNGVDWIQVETPPGAKTAFEVSPGPISSYMIIGKEDAKPDPMDPANGLSPDKLAFKPNGDLEDDPDIDYTRWPLCIHRAPVNINTASDKVLAALFMGIDVLHGHPMAIGTDVDLAKYSNWFATDPNRYEPRLVTVAGNKRVPACTGRIIFNRPMPDNTPQFAYLNNYGTLDPAGSANVNEAQELAYRIIKARQRKLDSSTGKPTKLSDIDALSGYETGPFKSWDDFYFRVVAPWDNLRTGKEDVKRMIMAHFNPNTDILKFNPNIEWIDRWGRNFTEMEPVMVYKGGNTPYWLAANPTGGNQYMWCWPMVVFQNKPPGAYYIRSLRYKSDEMIDKTDLNRSTTEFSFDSNGIFEIQSIGTLVKNGEVIAERKAEALVKVYDVWRESSQRDFVQGVISAADNQQTAWSVSGTGNPGSYSGKVVRDAVNGAQGGVKRLALDTFPEPLVPLSYNLISKNASGRTPVIQDVVDTSAPDGRDAMGKKKTKAGMPDAVLNRILPARWDGQIALATNTSAPNGQDNCTFLASFNGDLDTDTATGNGREQGKTPRCRWIRVLDVIALEGYLNDRQIDIDPKEIDDANTYPVGAPIKACSKGDYDCFSTPGNTGVYDPLDKNDYSQNVTCRVGDLRPDGVWLGNVGCSGKDATIKYLFKDNFFKPYPPSSLPEYTIMMWFKSVWAGNDKREHEFFCATRPGNGFNARYFNLTKYGYYSWCTPWGVPGAGNGSADVHSSPDDLTMEFEDHNDSDIKTYLHGGLRRIYSPSKEESPGFHVQPFRWGFVGGRGLYGPSFNNSPSFSGFWENESPEGLASRDDCITRGCHAFIDSQRDPEGPTWKPRYYWKQWDQNHFEYPDIGSNELNTGGPGTPPQEAAWTWFDGTTTGQDVFSANQLNASPNKWLYRSQPIDGTCAVVDEYKLFDKFLNTNRVNQEQTTSRYYLPMDPANPAQCPKFLSQTLLQSLKGYDKTDSTEEVTLVRVTWTVFTPRFLYENILPKGTRNEVVHQSSTPTPFRGPFDYIQYNRDLLLNKAGWTGLPNEGGLNAEKKELGVDRLGSKDYTGQTQATRGVEVEMVASEYPDLNAPPLPVTSKLKSQLKGRDTFVDPDGVKDPKSPQKSLNTYGDTGAPLRVKANQLRYRVRFRYPIDEKQGGGTDWPTNNKAAHVDPTNHYMVDTPVFDDISVTYINKLRILSYREVTE